MANQPKAYKKFVATAATATLVATAIAPVASAATDFKDVSKSYEEAVNYLVENGIAKGTTDTTFGTSNNISRGDAAVMIANALKLNTATAPDAGFQDVNARVAGAVNAIVEAKIASGKTATAFAPADYITRQEMAKMLANAYELTAKETANFKDVNKNWIGFVSALKEAGITLGKTETTFAPTDNLTRGEFALFMYRAEGIDTTPAPPVVTTATKVASVSATNLKQVVVTFDGTVDKATASEVANYSISGANSPEVDSAVVSEDAKSVTLNLKDVFVNQNEYKLSLNNIKAGDKVLSEKNLVFKPLDNTVPTVSKVEALGNKTVRVHFSEPVKPAQTSHFAIDGKVVVGSIQTTGNTVILKLSSALTDGEHTLTAEGIQDFNNFKVIKVDTTFNVVEDKTPPTVAAVVSASFEKVVLKFSEPVEQVFASNVYWMQGAAKKQASSVKALSDDTFEFTFVGDNKLVYTTDLYVTNVRDYSGNVIDKDTKVQVSPVIDQTRPEVLSADFVKGSDNKKIVLKFSKTLDTDTAKKSSNYVIKDKDGKTQPISSAVDVTTDKQVTITLLNALKDNSEYTLAVNGVSDNTTLKNVMLPYTTTLNVKDVTPPTFDKVTRLNANQLYVQFSEAMATSGDGSVVDSSKYTITSGGKTYSPVSFNITGDSKGVILGFNNNDLPVHGTVINVKVQLVKDLAGNYLKDLTANHNVATADTTTVKSVVATATDKVEVTFTNALQSLNQSDFYIDGHAISYAELSANGKTAVFTLSKDLFENAKTDDDKTATADSVQLKVVANPTSVDVLGETIAKNIPSIAIEDEIPATVYTIVKGATADKIVITFNEAVTPSTGAVTDFSVKDLGGTVAVTDVKQVVNNNKQVVVTLAKTVDFATISVKDARFLTDSSGNAIADIEATTVEMK